MGFTRPPRGAGAMSGGVYGREEGWSSGALEARCRSRGMEVWRYGALEVRYRGVDVEAYGWSSGGVQ